MMFLGLGRMRQGNTLQDYRIAPSGEGPLASEWGNKPHRLVYDLCGEVEWLRSRVGVGGAGKWWWIGGGFAWGVLAMVPVVLMW